MRIRHNRIAVAFIALLCGTSPIAAQDSATAPRSAPVLLTAADSVLEMRTRNLASQLRCPVCQGLSLQDSPSELSQQMRDVVRSQLAMGKTDDEVKAYFVERYGEWILMEPKPRGFNLLVYLLPFAGLVAGAAVLYFAVRRWTRGSLNAEAATDFADPDEPDLERA